jgi:hypothetical protein
VYEHQGVFNHRRQPYRSRVGRSTERFCR